MAGACAGCGITTEAGEITVDGPRNVEWPYSPAATIEANNGLFCGEDQGKLWVAPEMRIAHQDMVRARKTLVPDDTTTLLLDEEAVAVSCPARSNGLVRIDATGGYAGFRMGDGNWWIVKRYLTVSYDGVPVAFTGNVVVNTLENHSGGVMSVAGPVDGHGVWDVVPAGTDIHLESRYELEVPVYTVNAANAFVWEMPRISIMVASVPQQ